jgi:flavin-binding protein dodecin
MDNRTYKIIELVGSSPESIEHAIENGLKDAGEKLQHLRWFEVEQTRGHIEDGVVAHYQVVLKVGFAVER